MNRRQDVVGLRIPQIVSGQVIAPDRAVVAQEEVRLGLVREERIVVGLEVPQMMVGVDQRHRFRRVVPFAADRLHAEPAAPERRTLR